MGGGEVARYLSRYEGRGVIAAGLVSSVVPYLAKSSDNPDGVDSAVFAGMAAGIKADRAHFFRHTFFPQFFGVGMLSHPVSDDVVIMATATALMAGLWPTLACAAAFAQTDFRPDLAAFTMPTLIIHGTADKTVPIDVSARAAAKAISHAQLIEYDGEPHGLTVTAQNRLSADLLEFVGANAHSSKASAMAF